MMTSDLRPLRSAQDQFFASSDAFDLGSGDWTPLGLQACPAAARGSASRTPRPHAPTHSPSQELYSPPPSPAQRFVPALGSPPPLLFNAPHFASPAALWSGPVRAAPARPAERLSWAAKQAKGPTGKCNYSLYFVVPGDDGARAELAVLVRELEVGGRGHGSAEKGWAEGATAEARAGVEARARAQVRGGVAVAPLACSAR